MIQSFQQKKLKIECHQVFFCELSMKMKRLQEVKEIGTYIT